MKSVPSVCILGCRKHRQYLHINLYLLENARRDLWIPANTCIRTLIGVVLDVPRQVNNYKKQVNVILQHLTGKVRGEAEKGSVDIYFYIIVFCNKNSQILPKQQQNPRMKMMMNS